MAMKTGFALLLGAWTLLPPAAAWAGASELDEFKVKRQEVFEFAEKPVVVRQGDAAAIRFAVKSACDVTVAVEDEAGRIVRHVACGVLGPKAPEPFQRNSLVQSITWDGKDDQGRYLDRRDGLTVRVSLGLAPQFERTLFWSPKKRHVQGAGRWGFVGTQAGLPTPRLAAAPEGVYVYDGRGLDHLRLFDHEGNYVRTIYPPPSTMLDRMVGLERRAFPQDGGDRKLPLKRDILQTTFLHSGPTGLVEKVNSMFGTAATALAVRDRRIALVHRSVNRLATDGSTGGLPLAGPHTSQRVRMVLDGGGGEFPVSPASAAFSPDGKTLYCTGYMWRQGRHTKWIQKECLPGVIRLNYESNDPPQLFAGSLTVNDGGRGDGQFRDATSVDCDSRGRVYVSDYANDRVQVFAPDGKHLKNIPAFKPALVRIHRKTDEIHVFSWTYDHGRTLGADSQQRQIDIPAKLTRHGTFDDPTPRGEWPLPLLDYAGRYNLHSTWGGLEYTAEIDSWADRLTVWLVPGLPETWVVAGSVGKKDNWENAGIKLLVEKDGRLDMVRDFAAEAKAAVTRLVPPMWSRQRLYVNPKTGLLYVAEGQTTGDKAFMSVLEINPDSGAIREVQLPFDAEDMAFDVDGRIYLRTYDLLVRYDLPTWREVPFDYGEQRTGVGTSSSNDGRRADVISGLPLYGMGWFKGGMYVNVKGNILVSCLVTKGDSVPVLPRRTDEKQLRLGPASPYYTPRIFPGRLRFGELHVWDRHGRLVHEDVAPGVVEEFGVGLDKDDNAYFMAAPARILEGERSFDPLSSTLMKFKPGQGRIISQDSHLIPFPVTTAPDRPHDIIKGGSPMWVEDAEWMYGGVGYSGHSAQEAGGHCSCYNARFTLDYFARSFAPELRRFNVAVLDSNGNLIMRIGQYGNVDEGRPLVPAGGPAQPRSIGGDEVALMHGAYVAAQTDKRLFIADPGNERILSVKLGYHVSERVPLR